MTPLPALVLAGSRGPGDPMAVAAGVTHKALIPVDGVPMLERVVAALRATPEVSQIAVSIEDEALLRTLPGAAVTFVPAARGPSESVARAMERLGTPLLVTTADHALLRPEWIAHFLSAAPAEADVAAAVARAETIRAAAPDTKRTVLRFADRAVSGCNLFLLSTPRASRAVNFWRQVEAHRKRPLRLVRMLGPGALIRFALGRLTLRQALDRLGSLAGVRAAAVELPFGEAAVDVDKPADLELAERLAARRRHA